MKRWQLLLGAVVPVLLVGLMAAPAGAARGTTKIASVKGTLSGAQTLTVTCGWDWLNFGGPTPMYQTYFTTEIQATGVVVNASGLGSGTMSLYSNMSPYASASPVWTFQGTNIKNSLTGGLNININGTPQGQTESIFFNVTSGTGKFAGVSGGTLQTLPFSVTQPFCDPGPEPNPQVYTVVTPAAVTAAMNVAFYGQLLF